MDADERHEVEPDNCPSCDRRLDSEEVERGAVVCGSCDRKLDGELAAYLAFVAACRD